MIYSVQRFYLWYHNSEKVDDIMNQFEVMNYSKTAEDIIDELTLFDDDLMSLVFDKNIEATTLLLRIILQTEDIEVIEVTGQRELENPVVGGRIATISY